MKLRPFFLWFKGEVIFSRGGGFLRQTRKKETHIGPVVVEIFSYKHIDRHTVNLYFPASLWNRLISAGLKPVLCLTEISLHFNQFSRNNNIKIIKINTSFFVSPDFQSVGANKTGFNCLFFISISAEKWR